MAPSVTGLALGAGGARGLCHIGVIRALINHGIPFSIIAGASIGAVIGAMYAATRDIDWVEQRFRNLLKSEPYRASGIERIKQIEPGTDPGFLQLAARRVRNRIVLHMSSTSAGAVKYDRLAKVIEYLLPVGQFDDLQMPFACVSTDLQTGKGLVLDKGDLVEAVLASTIIPGYVTPLQADGRILVDGAVVQPVPTDLVRRMGADAVIAVDASPDEYRAIKELNILAIIARSAEISSRRLAQASVGPGDCLLHPDTLNLHWTRFDQIDTLIANGEAEVNRQIVALKSKLASRRGVKGWFRRKFRSA